MTSKEKNIILKNYKRIYKLSLTKGFDYKDDARLEFTSLLDELGLTKERYTIENEVISEKNNYNNIQREMFEMIFESFLKYEVYIHYDIREIDIVYHTLQFDMSEEEKRLHCTRINNILQYM
jgi:hypothetical protein